MNQQQSTWEEKLPYATRNAASLSDALQDSSCDMFGARIATTLLADLLEEDRCRIVEHIQRCSTCAARFQEYQFIEEFAEQLPAYTLFDVQRTANHPKLHMIKIATQIQQKEVRQKNKKQTILLTIVAMIGLLPFIVGMIVGESRLLLIAIGVLIVIALGMAPLAMRPTAAISNTKREHKPHGGGDG